MAIGMDQHTGRKLTGLDELKQRIGRLFKTRKGSLLLRRNYGSNLPNLVDGKVTEDFRLDIYAETAATLADPANEINDEFKLHRTTFTGDLSRGEVAVDLEGEYLVNGETVTLEGIRI